MAVLGTLTARAAAPFPDSTWTQLAPLPEKLDGPVFALAVDPTSQGTVLAGTEAGTIYRSTDFGLNWRAVHRDLARGVLSLAFNPYRPNVVLAGTRGGGAWRSLDGGQTWNPQAGAAQGTVRAFGFAKTLTAAASDHGVLAGGETAPWTPAGLDKVRLSALAVAAVNEPPRLLAGGDATAGPEPLPLFASADGAKTWATIPGAVGGSTMVASLAAGPLAPGASNRVLLMGTNTGLFTSSDYGGNWQPVTGGGVLPATDFTAAAFGTSYLRFYAASDGGASDQGGLWSTTDGGGHFTSLKPPLPAVTALAVSADDQPLLYVATFRAADHAVMLWAFHDTGGQPLLPPGGVPPPAAARTAPAAARAAAPSDAWLRELLAGPEAPYLLIGAAALVVLFLAGVAYVRRGRRL